MRGSSRGVMAAELADVLTGREITAADRHGKLLLLPRRPGHRRAPLRHDRPAGRRRRRRHRRARVRHRAGSTRPGTASASASTTAPLVISDPRRLGGVQLEPDVGELGPDALSISLRQLAGGARRLAAPLKARLLDQSRVAGLGNLLVDEILWRAGLDPARAAAPSTTPRSAGCTGRSGRRSAGLLDAGGSHLGRLQVARARGGPARWTAPRSSGGPSAGGPPTPARCTSRAPGLAPAAGWHPGDSPNRAPASPLRPVRRRCGAAGCLGRGRPGQQHHHDAAARHHHDGARHRDDLHHRGFVETTTEPFVEDTTFPDDDARLRRRGQRTPPSRGRARDHHLGAVQPAAGRGPAGLRRGRGAGAGPDRQHHDHHRRRRGRRRRLHRPYRRRSWSSASWCWACLRRADLLVLAPHPAGPQRPTDRTREVDR